MSSPSQIQKLIFNAKLAEQAERYEEMKNFMRSVVQQMPSLQTEERNLLSVAYKNVVGARRASWRVLNSIASRETDTDRQEEVKAYLKDVEKELSSICQEVLGLLTETLIPSAKEPEESVFYYKMQGDYHRYMAEYKQGEDASTTTQEATTAYRNAIECAMSLTATNPIRLGLALNFSVFYYEILDSPQEACKLAKKAFDDAVGELEELDEDQYKDATLIMQLLRDNLTLWQSEVNEETEYSNEKDMGVEEFAEGQ